MIRSLYLLRKYFIRTKASNPHFSSQLVVMQDVMQMISINLKLNLAKFTTKDYNVVEISRKIVPSSLQL